MVAGFRKSTLFFSIGVIVLSTLFAGLTPAIEAKAAQANPLDQLQRWMYYRGMRACLDNPDFDTRIASVGNDNTVTASDLNSGKLFTPLTDAKGFGYLAPTLDDNNDNDGKASCSEDGIFASGPKLFGFTDAVSLICAMNRAMSESDNNRIQPADAIDCENSSEFKFEGGGGDVFQRAFTKALEDEGSKDRPDIDINDNNGSDYTYKSLLYLIGKNSLEIFCGDGTPISGATEGGSNGTDVVLVDVVTSNGIVKPSLRYAVGNPDRDESSPVSGIYYKQGGSRNSADTVSCAGMAELTRENSADYAAWARVNKEAAEENESQTEPTIPGEEDSDEAAATSCAIDGVGWIVCPIMNFLATINDQAFGFLQGLLGIRPALVQDQGTLSAWSTFRDFANIAFVIAFMVIVYSQITSAGISNYGVKKMLPRIVIAAILVNISYYICAIAVDISNIVGANLYSFLSGISDTAVSGGDRVGGAGNTWSDIVGALLLVGVGILLIVAMLAAPTVLLALAVILLILIARQALVLILIIVSPLAFVAYLLPNTENWFKKWWKAFVATLMVYPIIGVVFGASTLASNILMGIAGDGGDGGDDEQLLKIVALAVMAVPLFAVPSILKGSLSAAGSIGTRVASLSNKTDGYAKKKAMSGRIGEAKGAFDTRRQEKRLNRRVGNGIAGRINKRIDSSAMGRYIGGDRGAASATSAVHKMFDEEVGRQKSTMSSMGDDELLDIANSSNHSAERRAAAAGMIMKGGKMSSIHKMLDDSAKISDKGVREGVQKQMSADMSRTPYGLGDAAQSALRRGDYGHGEPDANGNSPLHNSSYQQQLAARVQSKMSAEGLVGMDPDDRSEIARMASTPEGKQMLGANGMANLVAAMDSAETNETTKGRVKEDAKKDFATIRSAAGVTGASAASSSPASSTTPTPAGSAAYTPAQVRSMSSDNAQGAIDSRGGVQAMHESDLVAIRNAHGSSDAGQSARDELIRRGAIQPPSPRNLP